MGRRGLFFFLDLSTESEPARVVQTRTSHMPEVIEPRDAVIEPRTSMTLLSLQMARLQAELSTRGGVGGWVKKNVLRQNHQKCFLMA